MPGLTIALLLFSTKKKILRTLKISRVIIHKNCHQVKACNFSNFEWELCIPITFKINSPDRRVTNSNQDCYSESKITVHRSFHHRIQIPCVLSVKIRNKRDIKFLFWFNENNYFVTKREKKSSKLIIFHLSSLTSVYKKNTNIRFLFIFCII